MNGYNHVMLMGNLGKDPVAKYTQGGSCVVSFSLAVNRKVKDKDGTWKDAVDFIPVTVWGKMAEACEKYLSKGSPVMVEGRISVTSYDDKEGKKVWKTDVIASTVNFLGTKSDGSNKPQSAPQSKPSESAPQSFREEFMDVSSDADEDIPF